MVWVRVRVSGNHGYNGGLTPNEERELDALIQKRNEDRRNIKEGTVDGNTRTEHIPAKKKGSTSKSFRESVFLSGNNSKSNSNRIVPTGGTRRKRKNKNTPKKRKNRKRRSTKLRKQ